MTRAFRGTVSADPWDIFYYALGAVGAKAVWTALARRRGKAVQQAAC